MLNVCFHHPKAILQVGQSLGEDEVGFPLEPLLQVCAVDAVLEIFDCAAVRASECIPDCLAGLWHPVERNLLNGTVRFGDARDCLFLISEQDIDLLNIASRIWVGGRGRSGQFLGNSLPVVSESREFLCVTPLVLRVDGLFESFVELRGNLPEID